MEACDRIGKYRIIRKLGQGGEGCVYLAEDESFARRVAVKRLWEEDESRGGRLKQEAAFLRDLRHPMLPVVYELFYEEGWYLVMEYVEGISLHNYIETQGSAGEEQGCLWAAALLDILHYLHTRETPVIYRDLKPENIMVCRDGSLRLVDFGAAGFRRFGDGREGRVAYTAGYAAPEQRGADARADERSDIYAFGRILYYILTGVAPGEATHAVLPVSWYNPLLPEGLDRIIRRCIEEEPDARYQVTQEVMRDLADQSIRKRARRRAGFVRHVEKHVYLTEKEGMGLLYWE